jgi:DNA-binding NarL/FixJ family response regulator
VAERFRNERRWAARGPLVEAATESLGDERPRPLYPLERRGLRSGALKVLVADEHQVVRTGVRKIVNDHGDWVICAEAADGQSALERAIETQPDVAVLAVSLPTVDGITLTRRLVAEVPGVRVLLLTMHDDHDSVRSGLAAGARGYVLKSDSDASLEAAIAALAANRTYFTSEVSEALLYMAMDDRKRSISERFTDRERQIAQAIADGDGNKQIARTLNISIKTVESHRGSVMRKAGCRTAADFVRFAIKHNLVQA